MPFTFAGDLATWSDPDLAAGEYFRRFILLLSDLESLNVTRNVAYVSFTTLSVGGPFTLNLSRRAYDTSDLEGAVFPVGTPIILARSNDDDRWKPIVFFGHVTASSVSTITVQLVTTNASTSSGAQQNIWVIAPCQPSFDLSGTISLLQGGTGQTTVAAARLAIGIRRPTNGFEIYEDFVGYNNDVDSSAASVAFQSRFFAACSGGGRIEVGGFVDGYNYPEAGNRPGVAILSSSSSDGVAGVALSPNPSIHYGGVGNLHCEVGIFLPEILDSEYIVLLGLKAMGLATDPPSFRTYLGSNNVGGTGIYAGLSTKNVKYEGSGSSIVVPILRSALTTPSNFNTGGTVAYSTPLPGWHRYSIFLATPTTIPTFQDVYDVASTNIVSVSAASTTLRRNWMVPFVKLIKVRGPSKVWCAVDYIHVKGNSVSAR